MIFIQFQLTLIEKFPPKFISIISLRDNLNLIEFTSSKLCENSFPKLSWSVTRSNKFNPIGIFVSTVFNFKFDGCNDVRM